MRIVGILAVIAIIAFAYTRRRVHEDPVAKVDAEFATSTPHPVAPGVVATPAPAAPGQPSSGLRRPIDRTRQVIDQVQKQRAEDKF